MEPEIVINEDDIQFEPINSEIEDLESSPVEFDISTYPADYTLQVLYQKWKSGDIIIPTFQRGFVWKLPQASRLIESFMLGLPVPQIFLYADPEQKSLVIDGQQRLKSIFFFFDGLFGEEDRFGKRKIFKLEGVNEKSKWHSKTFDNFTEPDKRKLKDSVLRAIIVKQLNPKDDTSIYHIFERLNTGGTLLKNQEVRNCVYWGRLNDLLCELNRYPAWRSLLGKQHLDSRQKDVELILRYVALSHWGKDYRKPMKDFLSQFMKRNRNASDEIINREREKFQMTCDLLKKHLEDKPFNPRGALNAAVFDAVFVAFAKNLNSIPKDIKARYEKLLKDPDFEKFTRSSTTDVEVVKKRGEKAEEILFKG